MWFMIVDHAIAKHLHESISSRMSALFRGTAASSNLLLPLNEKNITLYIAPVYVERLMTNVLREFNTWCRNSSALHGSIGLQIRNAGRSNS